MDHWNETSLGRAMSPCDAQEPRPIRAVPYSRQPPELDHRTHPEL